MTDRFFAHGVRRSIHHHRGSKYVYKFAVDSPTNNLHRIKYCGKEVTGDDKYINIYQPILIIVSKMCSFLCFYRNLPR